MEPSSQAQSVTAEIEVYLAFSSILMHKEQFTYIPQNYYRDPHTRLLRAKLTYREQLLKRIEDPSDPLHHKLHGKQLRYGGKLIE